MITYTSNNSNWFGSLYLLFVATTIAICSINQWGQNVLWTVPSVFKIGMFSIAFRFDDLSRIFVLILSLILFAQTFFSVDYLKNALHDGQHRARYWFGTIVLTLSMVGVTFSAEAVGFLLFWELMSLSAAMLVATDSKQKSARKASLIYLGASRVASAFIAAGFLWMHSLTHSWLFQSWDFTRHSTYLPALFLLLGFCIKAGIWPFHLWLPYAYTAAPSTISALMSGFMSKLSMLAIIRILVLGRLDCAILIWLMLGLGVITSMWGIIFALVQTHMKRMIAYSSIENLGLILIGIALSLLASAHKHPIVASLAITASILHCINHGAFKSLLFLCAGAMETANHTLDLNSLGGLAKKMRITFTCMCIACFSAASVPPLNGFFGKWLLYKSLFADVCSSSSYGEKAAALFVICVLSALGALALATFVKLLAVPFLGRARTRNVETAGECSAAMQTALIILSGACIVSGLCAPKIIEQVVRSMSLNGYQNAMVASDFPASSVWFATFALSAVLYCVMRQKPAASYITWDCGFGRQTPKAQVTAESFAQPVARIFRPIFRYKNVSKIEGADWRHFPEKIFVETSVISILETKLYAPSVLLVAQASRLIAKLQTGSIHLYLLYVCSTLVVLLALGILL